jgi:hypothetical protein
MEPTKQQLDAIWNSADGAQRAEAPAFFATRTEARLEKYLEEQASAGWFYLSRPVKWSIALCLLLVINLVAIGKLKQQQPVTDQPANALQSFVQEYNLNANYEEY